MAVIFERAVDATTSINQSSWQWQHEVGPGDGRVLFVAIGTGTNAAPDGTVAPTVNGVPMVHLMTVDQTYYNTNYMELWYMIDPPTGVLDLEWDRGSNVQYGTIGSLSLQGVDPSAPWGTPEVESRDRPGGAATVTVEEGGLALDWLLQYPHESVDRDFLPGEGQVVHLDMIVIRSSGGSVAHVSASSKAGTGSVTMSWTNSGGANGQTHVVLPLRPLDGDGPGPDPDLDPITNLSATPGDGSVAFSWTPPAGATSQQLHRSTSPGVPQDGSAAIGSVLSGSASQTTDNSVQNDTTYYYRVSATDGEATVWSNEVSATPRDPSRVIWAALGDSNTDEYRAEQNIGGGTEWTPYILNWLEQLAQPTELTPNGGALHNRGLDFGPWGIGRPEPRRSGYEYNCARYNGFMSDLVASQLPLVEGWLESGDVTHVVLQCTVNEFLRASPTAWLEDAYLSNDGGVTGGITGTPLADYVAYYAGQTNTAIDRLRAAGAKGVVVMLPPDALVAPDTHTTATDPVRRGYTHALYADIYAAVHAHVADMPDVVVMREDDDYGPIYDTFDGTYVTAAGVQLNIMEPSPDGNPYHRSVSGHRGTIFQAVVANTFINAANQLPGVSIAPLTDAEILTNAGLEPVEPVPLDTITDLSAMSGDGQVVLNWTVPGNVSGTLSQYVHRVAEGAPAPSDASTRLSVDLGSTGTYTDNSAVNGTAYDYYVEAVDDDETTWSNSATATPQAVNNAPVATITNPSGNLVLSPGAEIVLEGTGMDAEDGTLSGASLSWSSNVDGPLGTGTQITASLSGSNDSPVAHTITLTATDSESATGTDTVTITVGIGSGTGITRARRLQSMATKYQYDPIAVRRRVTLYLEDSNGNPVTGESGRPQIQVNNGTFVDTTNSLVEVGNGYYYVQLTQNELAELGQAVIRYNSANTIESCTLVDVEPLVVVAAGSVTSASNGRNLVVSTGLSIPPGSMIQNVFGNGAGEAAIVQSYTSGNGTLVLEAPGFSTTPNSTTRFVVFGAPRAGLEVDANGRVSADVEAVAGTNVSGVSDFRANVSGLATASALTTVANNVNAILQDTDTTIPNILNTLSTFDPATDNVTVANLLNAAVDAIWSRRRADVSPPAGSFGDYLDAAVSAVEGGGGSGGDSASAIADAVLSEPLADHEGTAGSLAAVIAALVAYVDDLESRLTVQRAANLDNLDATVSSRLDSVTYTAPDNARIAAIENDTQNIQARLPASLVGGRMDANVGAIANNENAAEKFLRSVSGILVFTVGSGATSSNIPTSLTEPNDFHNGSLMVMVTGNLAGQKRTVSDFTSSGGRITPDTPLTGVPAQGDIGVIV